MTFCIYDGFCNGQFNNHNEIYETLRSLVGNLNFIRKNIDSKVVFYRNKEFGDKLLTQDKTIHSYIFELIGSRNSEERTQAQLLLNSFLKTKPLNEEVENILDICCSSPYYYSLISPDIEMCQKEYYDFCYFQNYSNFKIRNFYSCMQLNNYIWQYEYNPKHPRSKSKKQNGEDISKMDLSDDEAQAVLSKSICFEGKFYGFCERTQNWYAFKKHLNNKYHGYEISVNEVPHKVIEINENKPTHAWQIVVLD